MQKQELLSTIETLFWENAFSDLSMDKIAEKLGMKKASLYYHFPSKEAMFLEVLEQSFERYREFLRKTLEIPPAPLIKGGDERSEWGDRDTKSKANLEQIISSLILFPLQTKNLFAIVSQKGYCQRDDIRNVIETKFLELETEKVEICRNRFAWNVPRTKLFFALIESLSKRACLENCEGEKKEEMIGEMRRIFWE